MLIILIKVESLVLDGEIADKAITEAILKVPA